MNPLNARDVILGVLSCVLGLAAAAWDTLYVAATGAAGAGGAITSISKASAYLFPLPVVSVAFTSWFVWAGYKRGKLSGYVWFVFPSAVFLLAAFLVSAVGLHTL